MVAAVHHVTRLPLGRLRPPFTAGAGINVGNNKDDSDVINLTHETMPLSKPGRG